MPTNHTYYCSTPPLPPQFSTLQRICNASLFSVDNKFDADTSGKCHLCVIKIIAGNFVSDYRSKLRRSKKIFLGGRACPQTPLACTHTNVCAVCLCTILQQCPQTYPALSHQNILYETLCNLLKDGPCSLIPGPPRFTMSHTERWEGLGDKITRERS